MDHQNISDIDDSLLQDIISLYPDLKMIPVSVAKAKFGNKWKDFLVDDMSIAELLSETTLLQEEDDDKIGVIIKKLGLEQYLLENFGDYEEIKNLTLYDYRVFELLNVIINNPRLYNNDEELSMKLIKALSFHEGTENQKEKKYILSDTTKNGMCLFCLEDNMQCYTCVVKQHLLCCEGCKESFLKLANYCYTCCE